MSSTPPPGSPPQGALPWERRRELGLFPALIETAKLFATAPDEAWARTREKGDFGEPLLFAVLVSWIGIIASGVYNLFMPKPWLQFLPAGMREHFANPALRGGGWLVIPIILGPIFLIVGIFIASAILHLSLLIVGGLRTSTSGFEGTFRVLSYSALSNVANVVPLVGGLIALVWGLILDVKGIMRMHHTTLGRAITAIALPLILCCGLLIVLIGGLAFFLINAAHSKPS